MDRRSTLTTTTLTTTPLLWTTDLDAMDVESVSGNNNRSSNHTVIKKWFRVLSDKTLRLLAYLWYIRRRLLFKLTRLQKAFIICVLLLVTAFSLYSQLLSLPQSSTEDERPDDLPSTNFNFNFESRLREEVDSVRDAADERRILELPSNLPLPVKRRVKPVLRGSQSRQFSTDNLNTTTDAELRNDVNNNRSNNKWRRTFTGPVNARQQAVVNAFRTAWKAYKRNAWGEDELLPISESSHRWFGLGMQILDAIDTIVIMGLSEEYNEAREWIRSSLTFEVNTDVNLFECIIRCLAGLLSAHHLTNDDLFLSRAAELGDRLMGAFSTPSGTIPYSDVNLVTRLGHSPHWGPDSSTSEVATIQLELRDLGYAVNDSRFVSAANGITNQLNGLPKTDGLITIFISPITGLMNPNSPITIGARGDSYYEYLLKQYLQLGGSSSDGVVDADIARMQSRLRDDYLQSIAGIYSNLYRYSARSHRAFVGESVGSGGQNRRFVPKMDQLACFLPGTLALGVWHNITGGNTEQRELHMRMAHELMATCYEMFNETRSNLAPEIAYFEMNDATKPDMRISQNDAHYLLRPETIESLFYLWRTTGNSTYQSWAWNIFLAIERNCKFETRRGSGHFAYAAVRDVRVDPYLIAHRDKMDTFFLAETLKYLYMIFDSSPVTGPLARALPLDKYVINTEAHFLPIRGRRRGDIKSSSSYQRINNNNNQRSGGQISSMPLLSPPLSADTISN